MDTDPLAAMTSRPLRERYQHLQQFARWHRRKLAALCAAIAVFATLQALRPTSSTIPIVTARHDLSPGTVLSASDLAVTRFPRSIAPQATQPDPDSLVGNTLATGLTQGSPITTASLSGTAWAHLPAGQSAVAVRLHDEETAALLRPGQHVRLESVDSQDPTRATTLTDDATVLAVPKPDEQSTTSLPGKVVVFAVPSELCGSIAAQSVSHYLIAIWGS